MIPIYMQYDEYIHSLITSLKGKPNIQNLDIFCILSTCEQEFLKSYLFWSYI